MPTKQKTSPLSEDQFFTNDEQIAQADQQRVGLKSEGEGLVEESKVLGRKIITTLKARGTTRLVNSGWRTTLVQPESVVIDHQALLRLLTATQRRRVLKRTLILDLGSLPPAKIKAVKAAIGLTKYRACLSETVDPDAVSQAVQDGLIDADTVASVSEIVPGTAYLRSGPADG